MNKDISEDHNCLKEIKNLIIEKKITMENSERNPEYSQINKICFFLIIESLLTQTIIILKNNKFFNIYKNFNKLKSYISKLFKIEKKFLLFSKQLFNFEIIIKIFEYYEKQKKDNKEEIIIKEYEMAIQKILESSELLLSKNYKELDINLKFINNCLKAIFEESSDKYAELMNSILLNRYKLINNDNFRENIVKLLLPEYPELSNKKLIEKSYPLISLILGKSEPEQYKEEDNQNQDKYKNKFLNFVTNSNDKNFKLKMILNKDYPGLNEIIIYSYENCCQNYFDQIKKEEGNKEKKIEKGKIYQQLCGGMSKNYLNIAIKFIKDNSENTILVDNKLNILGKHYCIAYIKRYLVEYVNIIFENNYQYLDERKEINRILFSENTKISDEIKYYTLKICLDKKNNNYEELLNYVNEDTLFEFKEYFKNINYYDSKLFFYSILPSLNNIERNEIIDFQIYKDFYDTIKKKKFNDINDIDIPKELKKLKINDILYSYLYFNIYKSYFNNIQENEFEMKNNLITLISKKKKSEEINFISLLFNENPFKTKVIPKLGINDNDINPKNIFKIEILFYAFRFVFNIINEENTKNFYYALSTDKALETINNNMIPGKLSNTNDFIQIFDIIKQNFKKDPDYCAYICSCGYHYSIDLCTFPTREFNCPKCNEIIGGLNHILHRREGHKRVFFNIQYKDYFLNLPYADKNMPYILLKDLEIMVNNKKNELFKGLKKETKNYFLTRKNKVREISYITFRILNFILHGFILYSNIQGHITDEYLNNNLIESMSCFEIMEKDWEIIDKELKIKQIPNVQIFMNVIFDEVILLMKKQKNFDNDLKLNNFEIEIDKIIQRELMNKDKINKYIYNNNIMLDNKNVSDKVIIIERDIFDINIENKYPDMKYFSKTKLPSLKDFKNKFNSLEDNQDYYPIIDYLLDDNSTIKKIKYLPIINSLCNKIINYCSYRYSRDEAKKLKIKDEIRTSDELIDKFITIYEKIRPSIQQIDCHQLKDKHGNLYFNDLRNNQYLSNFCVDIGEFDYGMVLTGIYREMINWQNQFINIVLNSKNENHKNYSELFEQKIMIQDCNENDIIKFPPINEIMNNIIIKNSYQKNYGVIVYNYQLIEEELSSIILPSIRRFISDNEKCLRYVIYQFEGFRGNKSNIITNFLEKYKPKELNNEELKIINNYKNNYEKNNNKKMTNFLFSLQILIDIILENNYDKNELLINIIEEKNQNDNINILKDLFDIGKDKDLFTVDTLLNVFNIFEMICWEKIKENLMDVYLMDIDEKNLKTIDDYFSNESKDNNNQNINNPKIITKRILSTALRRFVSRYLSGKRGQIEINENHNLIYYLSKHELWDNYDFILNEEYEVELSKIFGYEDNNPNPKILVGQATKLYDHLGGDKNLLNEYFSKLEEEKKPDKEENDNLILEVEDNKKDEEEHKKDEDEDEDDNNDDDNNDDSNTDDNDANNEITY